jgi:hypothetical protein
VVGLRGGPPPTHTTPPTGPQKEVEPTGMTEAGFSSESGQTMAAYAVVLGVVFLAALGVFGSLAGATEALVDAVQAAVSAL